MTDTGLRQLILAAPSRRTAVWTSSLVVIVLSLALFGGQGMLSRFQQDLLTTLLLFIAAASAWNIIGGFAGQFSLANSAFIGAGAYMTVMAMRALPIPVPLALLAAGAVGAVLAVVMGLILFRFREAYFTVGSMAVALAALIWMSNWDLTGAATGISAPMSAVPDRATLYRYAALIAVLTVALCIAIFHSRFGLRLMALRDDEEVADSLGVSPLRMKLAAMTISGVLTAIAGGLVALQQITVEPFSAFSLDWSMTFVVMAVIGGLGSVWGPVIGAVVVYYGITVQLRDFPTISTLLEGLILVAVITVLPGGIVGAARRGRDHLARRRANRHPPASTPAAQPTVEVGAR